jgi:hypothetical protein
MKIEFFWSGFLIDWSVVTEDSEGLPASIFRYRQSMQIGSLGSIQECDYSGQNPFEVTLSPSVCLVCTAVLPVRRKIFPSHITKTHGEEVEELHPFLILALGGGKG